MIVVDRERWPTAELTVPTFKLPQSVRGLMFLWTGRFVAV